METCTAEGCEEPGHHVTWLENLTYYSVTLCLCREHHAAFIKLLCPFMREDERADILFEE
jgi:hypothetical protein